ncbi:MAG: SDR family NAD(P)-dependent oxidoreductase [Gammaproteobacteria bacterium]
MDVLVTGHTRGLGAALADAYLGAGHRVFGLARTQRADAPAALVQAQADFAAPATLGHTLETLLGAAMPALVFLNAGVLGPIAALRATPLATLQAVMDVNVWANKVLIDALAARATQPAQIVLISSGAGVRGNYGWGAYALSKATLNMLAQLYAHELSHTHLCALAPGLVATAMQDELAASSAAEFPSLARLHAARGTPRMPTPARVAAHIAAIVPLLTDHPSGSFVDVRAAYPLDADA